ncbi:MAG: ribonuclease P protein component [Lawsonella sp.]|nr:ribonuclease P protein component [Mycobacteriales bacterium]
MLSKENRLRRSADFATTVRQGAKASSGRVVVYAKKQEYYAPNNPPRIGLIVSKAVGNSVVRHQLSRRLRHTSRRLLAGIPGGVDVVIRALPGCELVNSAMLEKWIEHCLIEVNASGFERRKKRRSTKNEH